MSAYDAMGALAAWIIVGSTLGMIYILDWLADRRAGLRRGASAMVVGTLFVAVATVCASELAEWVAYLLIHGAP